MGLTQRDLGAKCGVTFQQIQKYETATNRMSAAVIWTLAKALHVDVAYFYDGLEGGRENAGRSREAPGVQAVADAA